VEAGDARTLDLTLIETAELQPIASQFL